MKITHIKCTGLNGFINVDAPVHEDINLLTGRNGSGKTTVLKALWYVVTGNFSSLFSGEFEFDELQIKTDKYVFNATVGRAGYQKTLFDSEAEEPDEVAQRLKFSVSLPNGDYVIAPRSVEAASPRRLFEAGREVARLSEASLFFPTFRRIEGGFARTDDRFSSSARRFSTPRLLGELEESLARLSAALSDGDHRFIASVSTADISAMLDARVAATSVLTDEYSRVMSERISSLISSYEKAAASTDDAAQLLKAQETLKSIQDIVQQRRERHEQAYQPLKILYDLIGSIFKDKPIRLGTGITIGSAKEAIASTDLSAGEKQMLGFLTYNAFQRNAPIFIDEPELSLHPDWQRSLLPILLSQETNNQFFIATHSPFIYSKFSDRELQISQDRGDVG